MAVNLSPIWGAGAQLLDNSGNVLSGGKIYTYAAGTTTPVVTYTSSNGITANSNPIILNSAGRVPYEIWLTDGTVYKFVLKDSNDVLIATYDNLTGINSNFVNFTNQQEIQTATAGQTIFNLVDMEYSPGTNSLTVFVDGVNQYGPGAQYAYVETDSNTVTFVSGLHEGASVKFTTSQLNSSTGVDAAQVSYEPPFTDSVATNVELKLAQTISVKDFGAVGDGGTDDTAAIQAALTYLESVNGGQLVFPIGTYDVTDTLTYTGSNLLIDGQGSTITHTTSQNTTLDIQSPVTAFTTNGALAVSDTTIPLTSTSGLVAGDTVYIVANASDTLWCKERSYFYKGEFCKIRSVGASSIVVDSPLIDSYITGATVNKINTNNISISNLYIERNNDTACLTIGYAQNIILNNVNVSGANERCIYVFNSCDITINNCKTLASYYVGTGTSYGLSIASCQNVSVEGGNYFAGRHGIMTGGTIPCRFLAFNNCVVDSDVTAATGQWGFDFHSNIQFATVSNVLARNGMGLSGINISVSNCISMAKDTIPFVFLCVRDSNNTLNVNNLNIINNNTNYAFGITTVGDGTSYDINVGDINVSNVNIVQNAVSTNPIFYFAGSSLNKIAYNNLNISDSQVYSSVTQTSTNYGFVIAGNSSTLNATAVINIDNCYIDAKCRSFSVVSGNASASVNVSNSVFESYTSSDYSARLGLAKHKYTNCLFNGNSNSLYVECTGGSVTFDNCTFDGLTTNCFYGSSVTYAAAFNCKNNSGVAFYYPGGTSPAIIIGINSATGARIATGTAAPTTATWIQGDIVYDTTPDAAGYIGWVCVSGGTPGTWKTFGAITA